LLIAVLRTAGGFHLLTLLDAHVDSKPRMQRGVTFVPIGYGEPAGLLTFIFCRHFGYSWNALLQLKMFNGLTRLAARPTLLEFLRASNAARTHVVRIA
jgi:hypothetical protein